MKETIVFVHGMCHGAWCWEEQYIPYFEKLGYNCIAFNLPGHETEGSAKRISFSLDNYVQALRNEVEKLNEPPIIIGHSMGGKTVMQFGLNYPGIAQKIIVVDIAPKFYPVHHSMILQGLAAVDLKNNSGRCASYTLA